MSINDDFLKVKGISLWLSKKINYTLNNKNKRTWDIKRGDVYYVDFGNNIGSEQDGIRPCVIISNNSFNKTSPTIQVVVITNKPFKDPNYHIPIVGHYTYTDHNGKTKILSGIININSNLIIAKERLLLNTKIKLKSEMKELEMKLMFFMGGKTIITKLQNEIKSYKERSEKFEDEYNKLKETIKK